MATTREFRTFQEVHFCTILGAMMHADSMMMLKPCCLSSRCSGSIIFTLTERTKKDTILGSFGTSKYEANCRKPSREHFRACARRSLVLWWGGRRGRGCKWSPPVVGGGSKLVCKLLLSPNGRRVKRMSVLLEHCVLGVFSKNDI